MFKSSSFDQSLYRFYDFFFMGIMQLDDFVDFSDGFIIFYRVNFFHVPMSLHQVGKF